MPPCEAYCHSLTDPTILSPELREAGVQTLTVFGLHIHPWLTGAPHRIALLEEVVDKIAAAPGVWRTTAGEIATVIPAERGESRNP